MGGGVPLNACRRGGPLGMLLSSFPPGVPDGGGSPIFAAMLPPACASSAMFPCPWLCGDDGGVPSPGLVFFSSVVIASYALPFWHLRPGCLLYTPLATQAGST